MKASIQIFAFLRATFAKVLCHCNIHPLGLLFAFGLASTSDQIIKHHVYVFFMQEVSLIISLGFQGILLLACTVDFTNRVKAVSTGMLLASGDDPLESPIAGRSARRFCWFAAFWSWLQLGLIGNSQTAHPRSESCYNCILVPMILGVLLAILGLCLATRNSTSACFRDVVLAYLCIAPTVLYQMNTYHSASEYAFHVERGIYYPAWLDELHLDICRSWVAIIADSQILIQAGCHPWCCFCTMAPCGVSLFLEWVCVNTTRRSIWVLALPTHGVMLNLALLLSHSLDYFTRIHAIRQGMQLSQETLCFVFQYIVVF